MASIPLPHPATLDRDSPDSGVLDRLARLLRLELELGLAETREVIVTALVAIGIGLVAGIAVIAALVVMLAGAFAPLVAAPWEPFVMGGGAVLGLALGALAWSVFRLRRLSWPRETLASLEETWRWLAAQTRSRLTSH